MRALVDFDVDLQSDIKHHRSHKVDIWESDSQSPCKIKKYQQSPGQSFGKYSVGPTSGARKPDHQIRQTGHKGEVCPGGGYGEAATVLASDANGRGRRWMACDSSYFYL